MRRQGNYRIKVIPCVVESATLSSDFGFLDYSLGFEPATWNIPDILIEPACTHQIASVTFSMHDTYLSYDQD